MQNNYDVIILGAGASGMTAALAVHENGLSVGLFEKQDIVGGTAGVSGGIIWAPMNSHMKEKGCLLYTSPSPRDLYQSRMPSSA